MKNSTLATPGSCSIEEVFNAPGLTAYGGANLLLDFMDRLGVRRHLAAYAKPKAPWADYSREQELEYLLLSCMLGIGRINQTEALQHDPLLTCKVGLGKLPDPNTLYRALDRFRASDDLTALVKLNRELLGRMIPEQGAILDLDSTVETVHGQQEGASVGYNPRYRGRASYQPLIAFEGQSRASVHVQLRDGRTPDAKTLRTFYQEARAQLPKHRQVRFVRGDRAFGSEAFCAQLEADGVGYALKMRLFATLQARIQRGVLWKRLPYEGPVDIEVGAVGFRANGWSRTRRVVLIRTRPADDPQLALFPHLAWRYEAIVTNLDWDPEDVWHFYNQRCACENHIKELKEGVAIDSMSKATFWPNAAHLWLKAIAYNILLLLRQGAPADLRRARIQTLQRTVLRIPALLVRHARRWTLRLPAYWPYRDDFYALRAAALGAT